VAARLRAAALRWRRAPERLRDCWLVPPALPREQVVALLQFESQMESVPIRWLLLARITVCALVPDDWSRLEQVWRAGAAAHWGEHWVWTLPGAVRLAHAQKRCPMAQAEGWRAAVLASPPSVTERGVTEQARWKKLVVSSPLSAQPPHGQAKK
jgi:hypothetical protein